jgi:hypothetical protein
MPAITTTRELFPKATVSLAQVQAEQNLRIAAGAIRSTTDDHSDPDNFILITDWNVIGQNDDGAAPEAGTPAVGQPAAAPAAAGPSAGFASNGIFTEFNANGASARTAAQDHLAPGQDASRKMANTDKGRVTALKQRFNSAAAVTGLPPALLAAIASRESRCGNALDQDGNGDGGEGFGIMQVDRRSHTPAGEGDPRSQAHIDQAAGILKDCLNTMVGKFATAQPARQLQAAIAAYNCGTSNVASPDTADAHTTGHDYSNDVWERAQFYAVGW